MPPLVIGRRVLLAATVALPVAAQDTFPSRPVRMIVSVAPGAGLDIVSRVVAQRLEDLWGQPVVVENRFGAAGTIGTELIAKAAPDGYTIGAVNSSALAIAPALMPNVPYDPVASFTPLGLAERIAPPAGYGERCPGSIEKIVGQFVRRAFDLIGHDDAFGSLVIDRLAYDGHEFVPHRIERSGKVVIQFSCLPTLEWPLRLR